MVVSRDHVLGAHVDEGDQHDPGAFLDEALVTLGHGMGQSFWHADEQRGDEQEQQIQQVA